MQTVKITKPKSDRINYSLELVGSKSISNRVLMIQALSGKDFFIDNLSDSQDTKTMKLLLDKKEEYILDAGDAGTAYRFMTAFLALNGKKQLLTGSSRMLERPIKLLAEALNKLGANISYAGKEGYPPLLISPISETIKTNVLTLNTEISSQYISALLMIAPLLPDGLILNLEGDTVSEPYIEMTIQIMQQFGAEIDIKNREITVSNVKYKAQKYKIESDWSALSYIYAIAVLFKGPVNIQCSTFFENSVQGDSIIAKIMFQFGVNTKFEKNGVLILEKDKTIIPSSFSYDFKDCPDLAQTLTVLLAALNIPSKIKGLQTLKIKETDRIVALKTELEKLGAEIINDDDSIQIIKGIKTDISSPTIETYKDHRMAMAFAPLAMFYNNLNIENPQVVSKSYPKFWEDLKGIGFGIK